MKCRQGQITTPHPAHGHFRQHVHLQRFPITRQNSSKTILRCFARFDAPPESGQPAEEAAATVSDCLRLATEGQIDALLEHVPDDVLDRCIAMRQSAR